MGRIFYMAQAGLNEIISGINSLENRMSNIENKMNENSPLKEI
jgi:hypothetical protein